VLWVVLVDPWDFPFGAGRSLDATAGAALVRFFGAGRPEAGLALGKAPVLRHVGRGVWCYTPLVFWY